MTICAFDVLFDCIFTDQRPLTKGSLSQPINGGCNRIRQPLERTVSGELIVPGRQLQGHIEGADGREQFRLASAKFTNWNWICAPVVSVDCYLGITIDFSPQKSSNFFVVFRWCQCYFALRLTLKLSRAEHREGTLDSATRCQGRRLQRLVMCRH